MPLQIIAFVVPLRMLGIVASPALMGLGRVDVNLFNAAYLAVLMPVGFLIGTLWGLVGVSLVWVTVFPIVASLNLVGASRVLRISAVDVYRQTRMTLVSGLAMYGLVVLFREFPFGEFPLIVNMLPYVTLGVVVYSAMTLMFNRPILHEAIQLAKS